MKIQVLANCVDKDLEIALQSFEKQFSYPLGPGLGFHIDHGTDYPRFFRAIGDATSHVAVSEGAVLGTLGAARRDLLTPDGRTRSVVYLGDIKVAPSMRAGNTLIHLANSAYEWGKSRADGAYGIVMDGTRVSPTNYSGRLGIPRFVPVGKVFILRIDTGAFQMENREAWITTPEEGTECYRRLSKHRYASLGGFPKLRSEIDPEWYKCTDGSACGRLEDTRQAKRLFMDNGNEIRSAHLSNFVFGNLLAGIEILLLALTRAGQLGFPALFVSVTTDEAETLCESLAKVMAREAITIAPATIYGLGLEPGDLWNVNTAEI